MSSNEAISHRAITVHPAVAANMAEQEQTKEGTALVADKVDVSGDPVHEYDTSDVAEIGTAAGPVPENDPLLEGQNLVDGVGEGYSEFDAEHPAEPLVEEPAVEEAETQPTEITTSL